MLGRLHDIVGQCQLRIMRQRLPCRVDVHCLRLDPGADVPLRWHAAALLHSYDWHMRRRYQQRRHRCSDGIVFRDSKRANHALVRLSDGARSASFFALPLTRVSHFSRAILGFGTKIQSTRFTKCTPTTHRYVVRDGSVCGPVVIDTGFTGQVNDGCEASAPCCSRTAFPSNPSCTGTSGSVCPSAPSYIPQPGGERAYCSMYETQTHLSCCADALYYICLTCPLPPPHTPPPLPTHPPTSTNSLPIFQCPSTPHR
jgi:hypothetical protein